MFVIVLVIVLFNFALCAEKRILGGVDAKIESYPYQVLIRVNVNGGVFTCGGSIVNDRHILTAAHCLYMCYWNDARRIQDDHITVYAGSSIYAKGVRYYVRKSYHPDNYNHICYENHENYRGGDIAILHLKEALNLNSDTIVPIKLANEVFFNETKANVTGWGIKFASQTEDTENLQAVTLDISNYSSTLLVSSNTLKDVCLGDSGGPLVVNRNKVPVQVGVVSKGDGKSVSYYTKVSAFTDFINNVLELEDSNYQRTL